jgi:hypothetical protein
MPVPCGAFRSSRVHHTRCLFAGRLAFSRTPACAAHRVRHRGWHSSVRQRRRLRYGVKTHRRMNPDLPRRCADTAGGPGLLLLHPIPPTADQSCEQMAMSAIIPPMPNVARRTNLASLADYPVLLTPVRETFVLGQQKADELKVQTYWEPTVSWRAERWYWVFTPPGSNRAEVDVMHLPCSWPSHRGRVFTTPRTGRRPF